MFTRARSCRGGRLTPEQQALVSRAVTLVSLVPALCSPRGALALLPTTLYLLTGTLKEAASKAPGDPTILADCPTVAACLAGLQRLVGRRFACLPAVEASYHATSHSGLLRVLDLAKTAPQDTVVDEVSLLLAIKVYLVHGDPAMLAMPDARYPAVNAFSASLQSSDVQVRTRCLGLVCALTKESPRAVALPYIQALAPQVIQWCLGPALALPATAPDLLLALTSLDLLDCLLAMVLDKEAGAAALLTVHIPILIHFLVDDTATTLDTVTGQKAALHDAALARLTRLGASHPGQFKAVLGSSRDLGERVRRAVVANTARAKARHQAAVARVAAPAPPSITLKMDFSNFK